MLYVYEKYRGYEDFTEFVREIYGMLKNAGGAFIVLFELTSRVPLR